MPALQEQGAAPAVPLARPLDLLLLLAGIVSVTAIVHRRWYRLDTGAKRRRGMEQWESFLFFLLLVLAGPVIVSILEAGGILSTDASGPFPASHAVMHGTQAALAILWVYRVRRGGGGPVPRMPTIRLLRIGLLSLLLAWPVVLAVVVIAQSLSILLTGEMPDPVAHETLQLLQESDAGIGVYLLCGSVVLVVPLVEEVLYRGLLQDGLVRAGFSRWWAILLASTVFAAMHITVSAPETIAGLFVLSLAFGWAYERTGRLAAPVLMHALFNAANILYLVAAH